MRLITVKSNQLKNILLVCVAGASASLFSSCVATNGFVGANAGVVRSAPFLPVGLIRTANSNWFYDPYRRSYYDASRRSYFNQSANRYYTNAPRRYDNRVYPSGWNGRGVMQAPRNVSNIARNSVNNRNSDSSRPSVRPSARPSISDRSTQGQAYNSRDGRGSSRDVRGSASGNSRPTSGSLRDSRSQSSRSQGDYRQRPSTTVSNTSSNRGYHTSRSSSMSNSRMGSARTSSSSRGTSGGSGGWR